MGSGSWCGLEPQRINPANAAPARVVGIGAHQDGAQRRNFARLVTKGAQEVGREIAFGNKASGC
jgi:hypothetical protein